MARRKRFNSEKAAHSFAKKVNGKVNDLRQIKEAKSPFTVTYQPSENKKTRTKPDTRLLSNRKGGFWLSKLVLEVVLLLYFVSNCTAIKHKIL